MSVAALATLGLTLRKRLATCPTSNTQFTVSPPKTVATFSSGGRATSVDWRRPARTTGGASAADTVMVRGAFGVSGWGGSGAASAAEVANAIPALTTMSMDGFTAWSFHLGMGYAVSPCANRAMPSVSPYFVVNFDRRTRSLGFVENAA